MNLLEQFQQIKLFVFDVDGVLTDGSLYVFTDGEQVRKMNIKDGFALQLAVKKGYRVMVMSGSQSEAVILRLLKLGIHDVFMNIEKKQQHMQEFLTANQITAEQTLFMGDDIPDLQAMKIAGLSAAPSNAVDEIKQAAHYISPHKGGEGCVRDVIEKVLKLNGHWELETDIKSK